MKILGTVVSLASLTLTFSSIASADDIPGLYNTGVDDLGAVLTDGTIGDSHFALVSVPGGTTDIRVRTAVGGYPIIGYPFYTGDDTASAWIGPNNAADLDGPVGTYIFRTTFDLAGRDPSTVKITGQWSDDDVGSMYLNGVPLGIQTAPEGWAFGYWSPFEINQGFVSGVNTLDFVVENRGGPVGLRVEFNVPGTDVTDATSSIALLAGSLVTLGLISRCGSFRDANAHAA
jgi:hypothetical protein